MSAKVSPLRAPTPGVFLGEFHIERFDISRDRDRTRYEEIRTKGNKPNSGITIENVRDQTETTETSNSEGEMVRVQTWYVVVAWWEKPVKKEDSPDPEQGFYAERKSQ